MSSRLAVAELLSSREPQIVVLDDALVFTDSHRHDRMLEIVKQLSEDADPDLDVS